MKTKPTMHQIDPNCIILGLSEERASFENTVYGNGKGHSFQAGV